jgi:DNA-binding winged helix-turn-helix (wHTH) protein
MSLKQKEIYQFGPFSLDPGERILWRDGISLTLTPKVFDTLLYLMRNQGRVLSKDELLKEIWPDTFVEEVNLTVNISILRKALGENPREARYIATVPGRGYRFIAEVVGIADHDESELSPIVQGGDVSELTQRLQRDLDLPNSIAVKKPSSASGKRQWRRIAVAAPVLAAALVVAYFGSRGSAKLTDKDTVVLADFSNATNDSVFDGTLRQGLSAQLEQSPFLNLLSDARIAQTLSLMTQPKDTRLTGELAREVCQRTASAATIEGSIASLGSQYVLGLRAVNCRNGDLLAEEQVTADSKEHVLRALGEAATKLRAKLGESLASVQKYDAPPDSVTTASLEALQAYSLAYREMVVKSDYDAAVPLFQRAISLDPNLAMAYARLGAIYADMGEAERGAENTRRAYELRGTVSERERFYIDSHYEMVVSGDLEAARKTLELWKATYPRDNVPPKDLGYIYSVLGDYAKSFAAAQDALRLDPGSGQSYANLVIAYVNLNRLDDAIATARQAQARHLDTPALHYALCSIEFLQHDAVGMQREVDSLMGEPGSDDSLLYYESDTAAYAGHLAKARELTRRAVASAQHADEKEAAAGYEAESAVREALAGNIGLAKQGAQAALVLSKGGDIEGISGLALALAGDSVQATRLADDLAKRFPENTIVQFIHLPIIHAANAIASGSAAKAIQSLAPAAPYEFGASSNAASYSLYPTYLRGQAFLAARQGPAAAAEFQKILDHPLVENEPIGALAHLELGRAYALSGDKEKARYAYQDFLTLWKNADPDIPVLRQARAEYAKLT